MITRWRESEYFSSADFWVFLLRTMHRTPKIMILDAVNDSSANFFLVYMDSILL